MDSYYREDDPVRIADIFGMAISALWQQKVRTLLTALGVVFGSFVLAASLSVGQGVQNAIARAAHGSVSLRNISVNPSSRRAKTDLPMQDVEVRGEMAAAKRERIRKALADYEERFRRDMRVALTQEKLGALAALEHVEAVVPLVAQFGFATLDDKAQTASVAAARQDSAYHRQRLVAGRFFDEPGERAVVVSEFLLYRWGLTDDAAVSSVLGKKVRLEFQTELRELGFQLYLMKPGQELNRDETMALNKVKNQLPAALDKLDLTAAEKGVLRKAVQGQALSGGQVYGEEFTITGVLRLPTGEESEGLWDPFKVVPGDPWLTDADVILPYRTATELFFRVPGHDEQGVNGAAVIVDREENVEEVGRRVKAMGLGHHSQLETIQRERLVYALIFGAMTCIAAVALLVAALGIANTMLMNVLERTREIGIMKAIGAGNGHLQLIFLVEGALIGLLGGGLGQLLALAFSYPANAWVRSMVSRDLKFELKEAIFVFPLWLVLAPMLFAVVVTTLAAVYPARRAVRVDPVAALRHE
jgi:putative ABC transport system permease protein